jgi:hypothetical protein
VPEYEGTIVPDGVLLRIDDAARMLEVTPDRIEVMVRQGMLDPVAGEGPWRFRVPDVEAVRLLGA